MPEDPYASVADLYDLSYGDYLDDVDFFANLAQIADGVVLELGVGTGRVAIPLAQEGYEVVGLDGSQSMLERAQRNLQSADIGEGSVELISGDMTNFDLGRSFGLIFVAADTFQHLQTTQQQRACVSCAARHLAPGGVFALSVRSPATVSWDDVDTAAPVVLDWTRADPDTGETVMKFISASPDPSNMVRRMTYIYDRLRDGVVHRSVFCTDLRYSTQSELELILQQEGLRVTHVYGDYDLSPVGMGENLILVARAEGPR